MKKLLKGASICALLTACLSVGVACRTESQEVAVLNINEGLPLGVDEMPDGKPIFEKTEEFVNNCFHICYLTDDLSETQDEASINYMENKPDGGSASRGEQSPPPPQPRKCSAVPALSDGVKVSSRLFELIFGKGGSGSTRTVALGGDVFGIKLKASHVIVADAKGVPALSSGDILLSVNGKAVNTAEEAGRLISASRGESVTLRAIHKDTEITLELRPKLVDGEYTLGLTLRDGAMGIGTMTFYDPETGLFGGLGHGICDSDGAKPLEMKSGEATDALLGGIHKGECGKPGELTGILTDRTIGTLHSNNECGVFGTLSKLPDSPIIVPLGKRSDVHEGEATVISTLKNGKKAEYKINIYDIDRTSEGSKSFRIKVTDPVLLALTGGIVRGMSGSPIIQDGKLVGAVTHVMVANPTEGYGIFIENMLNASEVARNELPNAA